MTVSWTEPAVCSYQWLSRRWQLWDWGATLPCLLASAHCNAGERGNQVWSTGRKRRWKQRGKQKQGWFPRLETVRKNEGSVWMWGPGSRCWEGQGPLSCQVEDGLWANCQDGGEAANYSVLKRGGTPLNLPLISTLFWTIFKNIYFFLSCEDRMWDHASVMLWAGVINRSWDDIPVEGLRDIFLNNGPEVQANANTK